MGDLSKYFSKKEFSCKCCGRIRIDNRLLDALESLRELVGLPIIITSGYRCAKHNKNIGGAADSYHVKGMAADIMIHFKKMSKEKFIEKIKEIPAFKHGGIGVYESWVHVDVRLNKARWKIPFNR